jgi:hypothetical protein
MRVPQVSERIKEAPAQALRGVFAGIGQLLLITDKLRNKAPGGQTAQQVPPARAPQASEVSVVAPAAAVPDVAAVPADPQVPDVAVVPEARDLDQTGNVRLLKSPSADAAPAAALGAPWPNYDELSIASLRARLRSLDVTQLQQLIGYERAHADRADVLTMFERRLAKVAAEAEGDAEGEE